MMNGIFSGPYYFHSHRAYGLLTSQLPCVILALEVMEMTKNEVNA